MSDYVTELGSLHDYRAGGVDVIDDDPKNYVGRRRAPRS